MTIMVDRTLRESKLQFIPISSVPKAVQRSKWEKIFSKIPEGQALVITPQEKHPASVRSAIKKLQAQGKFLNLQITTRTVDGERVSYVLNPKKESG